MVILIISIVR